VEYAALLFSVGIVLLRRLARRTPGIEGSIPGVRGSMAVALGAGVAVALGEGLVAASSPVALGAYFGTVPGALRLLRVALEALVVTVVVVAPRAAEAAVVLPIVALAAAGHAAAARPPWWGIGVDGVHLVSAGLWAGGILALALVFPALAQRPGPGRRELVARFSPVAIGAFLVTVGTGYLRATQELHAVGDLYRSPYGRVLALKVLAVAAMVPLSLLAWRRLLARPRAEALLALVVVAAAAVLAAFPLPPARVVEAGEEAREGGLASALPKQRDLTLGGSAGQVLLGVTLRPGAPGANEVLIYVLPLEGEEKAGDVRVEAKVAGRSVGLTECGPTCRRASVDLRGGEALDVHVPGPIGGRAQFSIPSLPAHDAAALAATMQARMERLERLRIEEVLRPATPPVEARYAFEAPDRMHMTLRTGPETVTIGATRYSRKSPAAPWEIAEGIPTTEVPSLIWSPPPFTAPRVVGSDEVEGRPVLVISFFEDRGGSPIWFKLWVEPEGLVRRAEMRAHGHFMDHRYLDFDATFDIEPPT
jgi:copper transport protein